MSASVWISGKKVFHHHLDLGFEIVTIPVRTTFEFQVKNGAYVPGSLKIERLYNHSALKRRYPYLKMQALERDIAGTIEKSVHAYMRSCGYLPSAGSRNTTGP